MHTGLERKDPRIGKEKIAFGRHFLAGEGTMKIPQEYLDKYDSLRFCTECKRPFITGEEVRITKKKINGQEQYVGFHILCPNKAGEKQKR